MGRTEELHNEESRGPAWARAMGGGEGVTAEIQEARLRPEHRPLGKISV